jgi:hypothetical protein
LVPKPHTNFGFNRTPEVSGFFDLTPLCDLAATLVQLSDDDQNEFFPDGAKMAFCFPIFPRLA